MKKPGSIFLALLLFISCVFSVHAESSVLSAPDTAVTYRASFSFPVEVYQFRNVTGLQPLLTLYDLSEIKIYEEPFVLDEGSHRILLSARCFPDPGTYSCRIRAAGNGFSQEIIFK